MTDIIERLRNYSRYDEPDGQSVYTEARLRTEAADEIERLRALIRDTIAGGSRSGSQR